MPTMYAKEQPEEPRPERHGAAGGSHPSPCGRAQASLTRKRNGAAAAGAPPPPGPGSSPGPRAAPALTRRSAAGRLSPGDAGPEMAAARPVLARAVLQQCLSARLQVRPPENGSEAEWVEVMGSQGSGLGPSFPGRRPAGREGEAGCGGGAPGGGQLSVPLLLASRGQSDV